MKAALSTIELSNLLTRVSIRRANPLYLTKITSWRFYYVTSTIKTGRGEFEQHSSLP